MPSSHKKTDNEEEREKPCFETSGKLLEDTNMFKGVIIKYNEPPEAKLPKARWRLYPFKVWIIFSFVLGLCKYKTSLNSCFHFNT